MAIITYQPLIQYHRTYQESLMTDAVVITRLDTPVVWPRTGETVIPCRVGEELTITSVADPQDANTRSQNEWKLTMPWDMSVEVADVAHISFQETGLLLEGIIGETNLPQSWTLASRATVSRPKLAVQPVSLTFHRDDDGDGAFELVVGTWPVKVVIDRINPLEVPLRYSQAGRTSYAPVRLIFDNLPDVPVAPDDIFLYEGRYGVVVAVTPNDTQQTEARAVIDFGGVA